MLLINGLRVSFYSQMARFKKLWICWLYAHRSEHIINSKFRIKFLQNPPISNSFFFVVSCKYTMVNLLKWALALIFSHSHLFTVSQNCISALTYAKSLQKYPLTHDISKVSRVENFCLKSSDQSKENCSNIYTNQFFGLLFCITQDFIMWLFQNSIWH